jgi:hypothetical protein
MNTNTKKKWSEITIQEIYGIQTGIKDLATKCGPPMASADSAAHKVLKIARQLLAAVGKIGDVVQDLNGITRCMLDLADHADADGRNLDSVPHILAWAGWTGDLTSEVLDTADDLIRAIQDLIGSSRSQTKGGS